MQITCPVKARADRHWWGRGAVREEAEGRGSKRMGGSINSSSSEGVGGGNEGRKGGEDSEDAEQAVRSRFEEMEGELSADAPQDPGGWCSAVDRRIYRIEGRHLVVVVVGRCCS
ncbi:unnamed protein product [Calypogeia fissa]